MNENFKTLAEFLAWAKDENACRKHFEAVRFAKGDFCPHCKHAKIMRFSDGKRYRCDKCKKDFTIKTGTLFGESKIPLQKWFIAIYLLTTAKKGISSISLAEQVGVTQKTAWYMDMRIREALKQGKGKLFGVVEVDETYIGGRIGRQLGRRLDNKTIIMGMTKRGGEIRAYKIPNTKAKTLLPKIRANVAKGSRIHSDELWAYHRTWGMGYSHYSVNHSAKEYVRGKIHTNSIESFWALFKRNYHGTYHSMSKKHLQRYINEVVFRFNNRENDMAGKFDLVTAMIAKSGKLSYNALTA